MQIHLIVIEVIKLLSQNYVMIHISDMVCKHRLFFFFRSLAQINCCLLHVCQSDALAQFAKCSEDCPYVYSLNKKYLQIFLFPLDIKVCEI